ncbi:MAG: cupin domain-containing protein [Clostridia bacterium]|nr:cupin domain-containing protein [Clostridia bacterium]
MYTALLSGGSGKRLWPLSNDKRSKQFVRILTDDEGRSVSMVQHMWRHLEDAGLAQHTLICTGKGQAETISGQLGQVPIALEPARRDTFPAIALSCLYALEYLGASEDDAICFIPVDPYTDDAYFEALPRLEELLRSTDAEIALMGATPDSPSSKYGYILPEKRCDGYITVSAFREKPSEAEAADLIAEGALWNCGVFCFRISLIKKALEKYGTFNGYDELYARYQDLPKISFDYEILEKAKRLVAMPFNGMWKDLGTWNAIAEQMKQSSLGDVIMADCNNTVAINELAVPVVTMGLSDVVVVAAPDGILVADRTASEGLKSVIASLDRPPMFEERSWGTLQTIDITGGDRCTKRLRLFAGMCSSCHYHEMRDEIWVILSGRGKLILDDDLISLKPGSTVRIPRGQHHIVKAITDLDFLEIHMGEEQEDDIIRHGFNFDNELQRILNL